MRRQRRRPASRAAEDRRAGKVATRRTPGKRKTSTLRLRRDELHPTPLAAVTAEALAFEAARTAAASARSESTVAINALRGMISRVPSDVAPSFGDTSDLSLLDCVSVLETVMSSLLWSGGDRGAAGLRDELVAQLREKEMEIKQRASIEGKLRDELSVSSRALESAESTIEQMKDTPGGATAVSWVDEGEDGVRSTTLSNVRTELEAAKEQCDTLELELSVEIGSRDKAIFEVQMLDAIRTVQAGEIEAAAQDLEAAHSEAEEQVYALRRELERVETARLQAVSALRAEITETSTANIAQDADAHAKLEAIKNENMVLSKQLEASREHVRGLEDKIAGTHAKFEATNKQNVALSKQLEASRGHVQDLEDKFAGAMATIDELREQVSDNIVSDGVDGTGVSSDAAIVRMESQLEASEASRSELERTLTSSQRACDEAKFRCAKLEGELQQSREASKIMESEVELLRASNERLIDDASATASDHANQMASSIVVAKAASSENASLRAQLATSREVQVKLREDLDASLAEIRGALIQQWALKEWPSCVVVSGCAFMQNVARKA